MNQLKVINCSSFLALAAGSLLLYYFSQGEASNELNILGIALLVATSYFIIKNRGGWLFLLYAFGLTFALSSGALIELTGAYLIEI